MTTTHPEPGRPLTAREFFTLFPQVLTDPYIPEVHGDGVEAAFAALGPAISDGHIAEQRHQLEPAVVEAAFADLAIDHPERCTKAGAWKPGGAA